ncbi:MAG TPA: ABC transporter substrate-binding protein [Thermoplasmata archaeon]|nr:ABC transporter substrate-binding protein [Thermoplasmata archaeon]
MTPTGLRALAIVVVLLTVASAGGTYYVTSHPAASGCHLQSTNPIIQDQPETPDTLDPAVTFSTPGWAVVQQIYQNLIEYNQSSSTSFVGELAKNWSVSPDGFHWNFTLWSDAKFSNGDSVTAYVVWYSLYRDLVMNQASSFILSENFWFPQQWYYDPDDYSTNWNDSVVNALTNDLNTWDFSAPSDAAKAYMEAPNQSFQVLDPTTIEFNLGYGYLDSDAPFTVPYAYVLPELAAPNSAAVDPAVIDAHPDTSGGPGIVENSSDSWMSENALGSGPFVLSSYSLASGYTIRPTPNYWATAVAASEPWNNEIQPAASTVVVLFQGTTSINIQNLRTQSAAAASFTYVGPGTLAELRGVACVTVQALPTVFGSTAGAWWIYMDQNVAPFNNLSFREAVVHSIDYPEIISDAFGGEAQQWVGPVPPAYPDYNPKNLPNYTYDPTLAQQELAASPWPNGFTAKVDYSYVNLGDWQSVAIILKSNLATVLPNFNPVPISLDQLYVEQSTDLTGNCITNTTEAGGPFPIGQEFYTSDYIAPDDWTTNDAISWGSANYCMSQYANPDVDAWVIEAAGAPSATAASTLYANITQAMYDNYTDAWLVVPTSFGVYSNGLHGIYQNPMGSAIPYVMADNTLYGS